MQKLVQAGFLGGSGGKESACNAGDSGLIPGSGRPPGGKHGNPLQYSCLENPHGQRNLAGYSPWGRKESNTPIATERAGRFREGKGLPLVDLPVWSVDVLRKKQQLLLALFNLYCKV